MSQELGVRCVLEGGVQKAGDRVRINTQLVDATTGYHLWAERYDRELKDIFAVQDEIVQKIVQTLKLQLTLWEQRFLVRRTTDNLEAYDYYLRGVEYHFHFTKEAMAQARQMYERAIELDPEYAAAYRLVGWTRFSEWSSQWSQDPQNLERAFEMAQKAIALNDDSMSYAHVLLSWVYLWKKQHDQAIVEAERAIALDSNNGDAYAGLAYILNFAGRPEGAIELVEKAIRLDPHRVWYLWQLGMAYRLAGRYEEAIAALKKLLALNPNFWVARLDLAGTYSELGREKEARAEATEILRINPNFSLEVARQTWPYKDPAVVERAIAALRKAGLK